MTTTSPSDERIEARAKELYHASFKNKYHRSYDLCGRDRQDMFRRLARYTFKLERSAEMVGASAGGAVGYDHAREQIITRFAGLLPEDK